jgi:hypothetical protein
MENETSIIEQNEGIFHEINCLTIEKKNNFDKIE